MQLTGQANILDEYRLTKTQEKALPKPREFSLQPNEIMEYSWDMPVSTDKRVILVVNGKKRSVNFQAIGTQVPFRYRVMLKNMGTCNVDTNRELLMCILLEIPQSFRTGWYSVDRRDST